MVVFTLTLPPSRYPFVSRDHGMIASFGISRVLTNSVSGWVPSSPDGLNWFLCRGIRRRQCRPPTERLQATIGTGKNGGLIWYSVLLRTRL